MGALLQIVDNLSWTKLITTRALLAGCLVLFVTSLPDALLGKGVGAGGLAVAMVLIGLGQGGVQAVIYPLLGTV